VDRIRFTCLLPVYAGDDAHGFARAVASVRANSLQPTTLLLCQDGALPAALGEAVARSGATVTLNPGPRGLHHNLNNALERVDTPWVCRADADDVNLPGRFERQAAFLAAHADVDVLGGAIAEILADGRRREKPMPLTHDSIARRARWRNPVNHMTAFIRTDAVRSAGGYPDIPRKEDYGLWLAMLAGGARFANLPDVLVEAHVGADFHARRSGFGNLATERALYRLGGGTPRAALIHAARALALSTRLGTSAVYRGLLRR
jgi:hypothetical protein